MFIQKYAIGLVPGVLSCILLICGCTATSRPRVRPGSYASATLSVSFLDVDSLGSHNYRSFAGENNGVVYTCRGGHIDLSHLRIAADNVYYLYGLTRENLQQGKTGFTYKLNVDPSIFHVAVMYPPGFQSLPDQQRQRIIDEVSLELAQYFTWNMISWHEILTWFGFKTVGFISEFPSAFSWEDPYSNLLGTLLGAQAIRYENKNFNQAMTILLKSELQSLGIQSKDFAYEAAKKMQGKWYKGYVHTDMILRNLDLGYDDGSVNPIIVPDVCPGAEPKKYPVPTTKLAQDYGFTVSLQIEPREFERGRYLKLIYPAGDYGWVIPSKHIPVILNEIRRDALSRGYIVTPDVELSVPYSR